MNAPFGRLVTAMVTPFDLDGGLDLGRAQQIAAAVSEAGSDAVFVAGSTGESPTLSDEERSLLYAAVIEALDGRTKVLAGTGTYDTAHSIELSKKAEQCGVDGLVAVTPYYSRPPQRGLEAHFGAIADGTGLPLLLYNIPLRTARLIDVATVCRLAEHARIVGVKDSTGDLAHTAAVRAGTPDSFAIYAGDDISSLGVMAIGGVGVVSVAAHVVGAQIRAMIDAFADERLDDARGLFMRLQPLLAALSLETNPIPIKAALQLVGMSAGAPRPPLIPAEDSTIESLREALARVR